MSSDLSVLALWSHLLPCCADTAFEAAAEAAFMTNGQPLNPLFDPYANDLFFLHGRATHALPNLLAVPNLTTNSLGDWETGSRNQKLVYSGNHVCDSEVLSLPAQ